MQGSSKALDRTIRKIEHMPGQKAHATKHLSTAKEVACKLKDAINMIGNIVDYAKLPGGQECTLESIDEALNDAGSVLSDAWDSDNVLKGHVKK